MEYSFKTFMEENYMDRLVYAAESFFAHDENCTMEVSVRYVMLDDVNYNDLKRGKDRIVFPIVLRVGTDSCDNGQDYRRDIYLRGKLSGSFSRRFSDLEIECHSASATRYERFQSDYKDDLLPVIKKDTIEKDAEALLNRFRIITECPPARISPARLAAEFGIRIYFVPLSPDRSIRGEYFYVGTKKLLYDESSGFHRSYWIPAKTILVEKAIRHKQELVRFTIMHELVHAVLQRYSFLLAKMCNPDFTSFFCPVRVNESNQFVDTYVERMERYADAVASCALMPQRMFQVIAEQRLRDCGAIRTPEVLQSVLENVAQFFGVSVAACRRRFLKLGFYEMRGIRKYVDGHYVPSYIFDPHSLRQNQTYTVSLGMAGDLVQKSKKLTRWMARGRVRFIENHFVIASKQYVTSDGKLTEYARSHLDECALKIDQVFPAGYYTNSRFELSGDGYYRTAVDSKPLNVLYADNNETFEGSVQKLAEELQQRDESVHEVLTSLPESFPKALKVVIEWTDLSYEKFAIQAGMPKRTLGRLLSGDIAHPSAQIVMRICIGLRLPVELSLRLMERSGNELRSTRQDMAYMKLLFFSGYYTITQCNTILEYQGFKTLGEI